MAFKRFLSLSSLTALLLLPACAGTPPHKKIEYDSQFWQRISASETVYMRGPKAQQMLNRDIARCVTELRELERLGLLKNAIPTNVSTGRVLDPDEIELQDWDTPERDKHLFAEHSDYHDFPSCMLAKGWERVLYVPYDVADEAREDYLDAHVDYGYQSRVGGKHYRKMRMQEGDFAGLND